MKNNYKNRVFLCTCYLWLALFGNIKVAISASITNPIDPIQAAKDIVISDDCKQLILWMHSDLENYLANFDKLFFAKLQRIESHEALRLADLKEWLKPLYLDLQAHPEKTEIIQLEIDRRAELHKPHGLSRTYKDASDFINQFVGPERSKPIKLQPTERELQLMNRPGHKKLYLDTWFVPFFNTGTQTVEDARKGVKDAIKVFSKIKLSQAISLYKFMELVSLFARPEFDDIRRYKLQVFPSSKSFQRFGKERLDAWAIGERFPDENFIVTKKSLSLDSLSFTFGMRTHFMGLTSHGENFNFADGRHFTGPADFLEHDQSHGYFNLRPAVPGTPEQWQKVHNEFAKRQKLIEDNGRRLLNSLVYFHFTHESAYKSLLQDSNGNLEDPNAYLHELDVMIERIQTRNDYDWIFKKGFFDDSYQDVLRLAFVDVSSFFKTHFTNIQNKIRRDQVKGEFSLCDLRLK
ncbi:MAG: hypothetical protein H6625_00545 [Bdellovibrionaceae bacterium]|nr:hypothetical protein [Pseudobdellovibrionaceae bacterium]